MKNNLIKETNKIKELITLLESNDQECVDQLKNSGYKVLSPDEQRTDSSSCESDTNLKCVIDYLKTKNLSYKVGKHSGNCYVIYKGGQTVTYFGKSWFKDNITFWSNGTISYIGTFSNLQKLADGREVFQVMYEGNYTCSSNAVTFNNMVYSSIFANGETNKKISGVTFELKNSDGTSTGVRVDQIITGSSGRLEDLI
jgi:hypothetical protein